MKFTYANRAKTKIGLLTHNGHHSPQFFFINREKAKTALVLLKALPKRETRAEFVKDAARVLTDNNLLD